MLLLLLLLLLLMPLTQDDCDLRFRRIVQRLISAKLLLRIDSKEHWDADRPPNTPRLQLRTGGYMASRLLLNSLRQCVTPVSADGAEYNRPIVKNC